MTKVWLTCLMYNKNVEEERGYAKDGINWERYNMKNVTIMSLCYIRD